MLTMAFSRYGVPIAFVAYDGLEAIELFQKAENKPDIVQMDNDMPGQNGVDGTRQILAISPGIKIVFLTGARMDRSEALALGSVTILDKQTSLRKISIPFAQRLNRISNCEDVCHCVRF